MSNDTVWRQQVTANAGASSAPILLPAWIDQVAVTALPGGGGTCVVQHTMDDPTNLVNWVDWDEGSVAVKKSQALMGFATALRINAVTAAATLQVVGVRKRQ